MTDEQAPASGELTTPTCYRHAGRETHIRCQRCDRPICPDCMRQAAVGFQCPDCVKEGARSTRQARTAYGGRRPATPGLVTTTLIALNALTFLLVYATGRGGSRLVDLLALRPLSPCTAQLIDDRRCPDQFEWAVADGSVWQLVTSMFAHAELWHVGFNMLALYILGPQLEVALGRARFLALYLLSGLVGSATVYWWAGETTQTLGASGAIFGLLAALLVVAVKSRGDVQGLVVLLAVNLAITFLGRGFISWQGHLGGLVGGMLIALVLVYAPRRGRTGWQAAGLALVTVATLGAVVARTLVLQGG